MLFFFKPLTSTTETAVCKFFILKNIVQASHDAEEIFFNRQNKGAKDIDDNILSNQFWYI